MGLVFAGRDRTLDRAVAIKLLAPHLGKNRAAAARFWREARAMARISHPATVQVFDRGEDVRFGPFLVMERLDGENLSRFLHARGPLPEALGLALADQLCATVQAAHEAGVVHRDLKPGNVFVLRDPPGAPPRLKLLDFGVAKVHDDGTLTQAGDILGTLAYMAPERWVGTNPVDVRADVYALGAIVYEMLSGQPPFRADTRAALRLAIINDPPAPLRARRPELPGWLAAVVERALDKRPERRYASARAFARALGIGGAEPAPDDTAPSEGFAGTERFRVVRMLACGQHTEVYEVHDRERRRAVALKRLRNPEGEAGFRLKREFRAAAGIHHPNLVRLDALIEERGDLLLVMDLVQGISMLDYVVGAHGRLAEDRLRHCLAQLVRGLGALHAGGLAHRDVKPQNVLVEPTGRLVLLDCGLASRFGAGAVVRGTPAYMAPEALEGQVGPEGDLYAVGVLLRQALRREPPLADLVTQAGRRTTPTPLRSPAPRDLLDLCDQLLAADPRARPGADAILRRLQPPAEAAPPSGDPSSSPPERRPTFIGRADALATLTGHVADAAGGAPQLILIQGESGIGKTALLDSFRRQLEDEGRTLVLTGRAREGESVPFPALDEAIDDLGSHLLRLPLPVREVVLPRRSAPLAQLFPTLTRVPAMAQAVDADAAAEVPDPSLTRQLAFGALRELFRRLCDRQRVVVLVDDMQWLDADSTALLARILGGPDAPPLLVVGALRGNVESSELGRLANSLQRAPVRLELGPLSHEDAMTLVRERWRGDGAVDESTIDRAARQSAGVPFFAELLAAHPGVQRDREVPTLEAVLVARHAGLPAKARHALELLCVSSRPLKTALALKALGATSNPRVLDPLFAGPLIRFTRIDSDWAIEPYHGKIRDSIQAAMPAARRRAHHRRLARRLLAEPTLDPDGAVEHLAGGGETRTAAAVAMRAAALANDQLAFDRAAALFALALTHGRFAREKRVAIRQQQALALRNAGRRNEAGGVLLRAADEARNAGLAAALCREAGFDLLFSGDVKHGLEVLAPPLARAGLHLPESFDEVTRAFAIELGALEARGLAPASFAPPGDADQLQRIDFCLELAQGLGHIDLRALPLVVLTLRAALDAGEPRRLQRALALFVINTVEAVPTPLVRPALEMCRALTAATADDPYAQVLFDTALAENAHFEGDFLAAEAAFERAERTLMDRCTGATRELAVVRDFAAFLQYSQKGDFKTQLHRTQRWQAQADAAQDRFHGGMLRVAHAIVWVAHDQPARARAELQRARSEWTGTAGLLEVAAALYHDIIDRYEGNEAALRNSGPARLDMLRGPAAETPFLSGYLGLHGAWRSLRALAHGGGDGAEAARVRDIVTRLRGLAPPIWLAVAAALEANLDYLLGERERALRELDQAEQIFLRLHMLCLAACARKRRGQFMTGELGARIEAEADAQLQALGVVSPDRWAGAYWSMFDARALVTPKSGRDAAVAGAAHGSRSVDGQPR
jgi:serine/threonine protein kinase